MLPLRACAVGGSHHRQHIDSVDADQAHQRATPRQRRACVTGYHRCGSGWHHIGAVVYDGTAVNGAEWSATQYGYTSVVDRVFSVPAGKTVGTFYEMQLQVKQSVGGMTGWNVRLDSLYEDQITIPAGYDETTRWTHGDYAFGDSGGPPHLIRCPPI